MLRGYGAEVVITPTAVEHDSPESYYSVSSRLAEEIPGGFKPDQYSNMSNPEAHYRTTGPEICEQTGGELDAIVISVGTGGTISGVGRYFKEHAPNVQDRRRRPGGLRLHREERQPTCIRTSSRGSARTRGRRRWTRRSSTSGCASPTATRSSPRAGWRARKGCSSAARPARRSRARSSTPRGSGPSSQILTILPDSGRSYLSKFLDDNWMLEHGFLERSDEGADRARAAAREAGRDAGLRHDLRAPEGRRGDRRDGALLDLAASGRARRRGRVARRRDRLAAGPRAARPRLQERRRAARGRRVGDAGAARDGRGGRSRSTRSSPR